MDPISCPFIATQSDPSVVIGGSQLSYKRIPTVLAEYCQAYCQETKRTFKVDCIALSIWQFYLNLNGGSVSILRWDPRSGGFCGGQASSLLWACPGSVRLAISIYTNLILASSTIGLVADYSLDFLPSEVLQYAINYFKP